MSTLTSIRIAIALTVGLALTVSCGGDDGKTLTLYTCASDMTVQKIISEFESRHPDVDVSLYRAPTGDLNARVASDVRSGGLEADVIWACDPLTMQAYDSQDLLADEQPSAPNIPDQYRTDDYVGAHILYVVAVYHDGAPAPATWGDLTDPVYQDSVVVPDPAFAASALGVISFFLGADGFGESYLRALADNGAAKVSSPDDVVTDVAQGTYDVGIGIASSAYLARDDGSPIGVAWPEPGAISVYGPIAVTSAADEALAEDFAAYVVSEAGQHVVADTGSYPTMTGLGGPPLPPDASIVQPDWGKLYEQQDTVLDTFDSLLGG